MPFYLYKCMCGLQFERFMSASEHKRLLSCECGGLAEQVITPSLIIVQKDVCYDSPIDGRQITSMRQRANDMASNDCVEYEPGMRQDADRNARNMDMMLEKSFDDAVDRAITEMPTIKRERLDAELSSGLTAETIRL